MVTISRVGGTYVDKTAEFYGLSTDTKPISDEIPNGSIFIEMDTSQGYFFDAENQAWILAQRG